jgi:peptide/nickel transport system permease protein
MKFAVKLSLVILSVYFAAAIFGEVQYRLAQSRDVIAAYNVVDLSARYLPPSAEHWLGTDNLGRDVGLRLIQGARIAFIVGVATSILAIFLGTLFGLLGGYFGGKTDSVVVWLSSTVASMPGLLFILAISLVVGKGIWGVIAGIGLTTWVGVCRTIRAEVMKHRERAYVQAARVLGYSHARIMFRHILPNVAHIILIQFSIRFPSAVSTEVFISFLGIGVQGEPSWGIMINNARLRLWQGVWWEMAFTTLAIFLLVMAFNQLADYLRDRLDPALRSETAPCHS